MGMKIFNMLPSHIKDLHKIRGQFKNILLDLLTHTFYSVEEYFNVYDFYLYYIILSLFFFYLPIISYIFITHS